MPVFFESQTLKLSAVTTRGVSLGGKYSLSFLSRRDGRAAADLWLGHPRVEGHPRIESSPRVVLGAIGSCWSFFGQICPRVPQNL